MARAAFCRSATSCGAQGGAGRPPRGGSRRPVRAPATAPDRWVARRPRRLARRPGPGAWGSGGLVGDVARLPPVGHGRRRRLTPAALPVGGAASPSCLGRTSASSIAPGRWAGPRRRGGCREAVRWVCRWPELGVRWPGRRRGEPVPPRVDLGGLVGAVDCAGPVGGAAPPGWLPGSGAARLPGAGAWGPVAGAAARRACPSLGGPRRPARRRRPRGAGEWRRAAHAWPKGIGASVGSRRTRGPSVGREPENPGPECRPGPGARSLGPEPEPEPEPGPGPGPGARASVGARPGGRRA